MKPEKVAWFNRKIDSLKSPMQLIKLMYDLVLSGEGHSVVGSKNSMASNNYRQKFGEELADQMPGEYDMEGDHVKHNLKTIMRSCKRLYNALGDDENLPEWVEDKIAQAQSMLISATEYMLSTHEDDAVLEEFSKEFKKKIKEARKSPWDKMAGAVKQSSGKDLNKGDERAQYALKGLKQSAKDYQNIVDKDKTVKEAKNPAQGVEEGWKSAATGAALLGLGAMGAGGQAQAADMNKAGVTNMKAPAHTTQAVKHQQLKRYPTDPRPDLKLGSIEDMFFNGNTNHDREIRYLNYQTDSDAKGMTPQQWSDAQGPKNSPMKTLTPDQQAARKKIPLRTANWHPDDDNMPQSKFESKDKTGPKFTGYWKGTNKGKPGNKIVGDA